MIEFDSTADRRLPVYLLLDISGSMSGDGIEAVNQGVQLLLTELKNDRWRWRQHGSPALLLLTMPKRFFP